MADIVFLAVGLASFGLCALYVRACDRLIGAADEPVDPGLDGPAGVAR